jgi:hypothetical protein
MESPLVERRLPFTLVFGLPKRVRGMITIETMS